MRRRSTRTVDGEETFIDIDWLVTFDSIVSMINQQHDGYHGKL